jgi:hypothetical protein
LEAWGDPGTGGAASGAGAGDAVVEAGDAVVEAGDAVVEAGAAGVEDEAGGVFDAGGVCWLVCGLFCAYPVKARPGTNSKLLANINSAGISFLRSILLIGKPLDPYDWQPDAARSGC